MGETVKLDEKVKMRKLKKKLGSQRADVDKVRDAAQEKLMAAKKEHAKEINLIKERYQKKLDAYRNQMQQQLHQSALDAARKARLEAETTHAHMSVTANELKAKAQKARLLAKKAKEKAKQAGMKVSSSETTKSFKQTIQKKAAKSENLKKQAAAELKKAKSLEKK